MSKSNNKWVYEPWHPLEILAMKSFVVPCSQEPRSHLQGICSLTLRVQITIWKGAKKQCVGIVVLSKTINLFLYIGIHLWVPFTYIKKRKLHDHRAWNWMRPSKYAIGTSNPELRTWTKSQDNSPQFKTSFLLGLLGLVCLTETPGSSPMVLHRIYPILVLLSTPLQCEETNGWITLHLQNVLVKCTWK